MPQRPSRSSDSQTPQHHRGVLSSIGPLCKPVFRVPVSVDGSESYVNTSYTLLLISSVSGLLSFFIWLIT